MLASFHPVRVAIILTVVFTTGCGGSKPVPPAAGPGSPSAGASATGTGTSAGSAPSAADKIDAMPVGDFVASLGAAKGVLEADPHKNKTFRLRGTVLRVTPEGIGSAYARPHPRVWLRGDAQDPVWGSEPVVGCSMKELTEGADLRPGQNVVIEGRYSQFNAFNIIYVDACRLLAVESAPTGDPAPPPYRASDELERVGQSLDAIQNGAQWKIEVGETFQGLLRCTIKDDVLVDGKAIPQEILDGVKTLTVDEVSLKGAAVKSLLAHLDSFPRLQSLIIQNDLDVAPDELEGLSKARHLDSIEINSAKSFDDAMAAALAKCATLRSVTVGKPNSLGDAGVAALAGLPHLTQLSIDVKRSFLEKDKPKVTNASIAPLSKAPHLSFLRIEGAEISGAGFEGLAKGSFPALRFLHLPECPIDDDAVDRLIASGLKLRGVNLEATPVTEAALLKWHAAKLVDRFHLSDGTLGEEGQKALEATGAVPKKSK